MKNNYKKIVVDLAAWSREMHKDKYQITEDIDCWRALCKIIDASRAATRQVPAAFPANRKINGWNVPLVAGAVAILLCSLACGCSNQVGPSATTQPIFGPDSFHVYITIEKLQVGSPDKPAVEAPITANAYITVNGHVFSATAPASQPTSQPAKGTP